MAEYDNFSYDCFVCEKKDTCTRDEYSDPCEHFADCTYCEFWADEYTDECQDCCWKMKQND